MAIPVVVTSAQIQIFWNNKQYKEIADISFTISYDEEVLYGIDSPYGQEIAGGKISVTGNVSGFMLKNSGGLEGKTLRPLFTDVSASPYVSLRVSDRTTGTDLLFVPQAKVTSESHSIPSKGTYKLNFSFVGLIPFQSLDRS